MNIKRAKEEIRNTVEAYLKKDSDGEYLIPVIRQRPILLLGAPGIGKTQIMEQVARECGIALVSYTITHHTRQSAIGLPFISKKTYGGREYSVTEYTMSEIIASVYDAMEETGLSEGILFIDEINCVSETLAPAMLQFLQCKTFGSHAVPEGWMIAAAGNPPEYNKSVRELDVVTLDRVKKIPVEPDFEVWKAYAWEAGIHPAIISYLDARPSSFYQMETTVDGTFFATPRGWEDLSGLLKVYEQLGKTADAEVVQQYIQHPRTARDFANYLDLYRKYQTDELLAAVLQEGRTEELLLKKLAHAPFDERLSVISVLAARVTAAMRNFCLEEEYLTKLHNKMKLWKEGVQNGQDGAELLGILAEDAQEEYRRRKRAKLLQRDEAKILKRTAGWLARAASSPETAEECFGREVSALEAGLREAGVILERAFDFMEDAFGNSQEMVRFVTELNLNVWSVRFLQEYECERYYRYNKELLFDEKRRRILNRIERLERLT